MDHEIPKIPDTPEEIFVDLASRDEQRKKAIDIAHSKADAAREAGNVDDEVFFINLADTMSDARFDLHNLFPEVFGE